VWARVRSRSKYSFLERLSVKEERLPEVCVRRGTLGEYPSSLSACASRERPGSWFGEGVHPSASVGPCVPDMLARLPGACWIRGFSGLTILV
jgi:hypothetical protein